MKSYESHIVVFVGTVACIRKHVKLTLRWLRCIPIDCQYVLCVYRLETYIWCGFYSNLSPRTHASHCSRRDLSTLGCVPQHPHLKSASTRLNASTLSVCYLTDDVTFWILGLQLLDVASAHRSWCMSHLYFLGGTTTAIADAAITDSGIVRTTCTGLTLCFFWVFNNQRKSRRGSRDMSPWTPPNVCAATCVLACHIKLNDHLVKVWN